MPEDLRREWHLTGPHCRANTLLVSASGAKVRIHEKAASAMPASESLQDTCNRLLPLWLQSLAPRLARGETVLVVAHANTVKAMLYFIDPKIVTTNSFGKFKIPSAVPLLYQFSPANDDDSSNDTITVPGGLQVVVPDATSPTTSCHGNDLRHALHGTWIETDEIGKAQFCTPLGQHHLEHEIA